MLLDDYQIDANKTAIYPASVRTIYPALGLAGEAGEVCNTVKKVFRDDEGVVSDEKRKELAGELGDVLWYLAVLASDLGLSLDQIAQMNLRKLKSRQERGVLQGSGGNR